MRKKTQLITPVEELLVDLTFHAVPAHVIEEFAEKIVKPYYNGNLNAAIQDLMQKAMQEQDLVYSHITHIRNATINR